MPAQVLHSKEEFDKAVNGPRAVVVDLSNENSAHKGMHPLFDEEIHRCNVPGYRVDPKVSSSIGQSINCGIYQAYHNGKIIHQITATNILHVQRLRELVQMAASL